MPATIATPNEEAADYIAKLVQTDPRRQSEIAQAARLSEGHITHLKTGHRNLTVKVARKLARVWPDEADQLRDFAERIEDATEEKRCFISVADALRKHVHVTLPHAPHALA